LKKRIRKELDSKRIKAMLICKIMEDGKKETSRKIVETVIKEIGG
jgi:ribosomal protein S7